MSDMSYGSRYLSRKTINFEPPLLLEKGDIVWVRWKHYRHGDVPESATPTKVIKVYDDGNILHKKDGYDDIEFAWARDIFAKSPGLPYTRMPYRTVPLSDIREAIFAKELEAAGIEV